MFTVLAIVCIFLDQFTKYLFEHQWNTSHFQIWSDYISLSFVKNQGIAFSFPIEGLFLKILTVGLIGGIIYYFFYHEKYKNIKLVRFSYTLILSGAISNAFDRVFFGFVTDFIAVKYFAIFNFADIFISIGAFLLFIAYLQHERNT